MATDIEETKKIAQEEAYQEVRKLLRICECPKCQTSTVFVQTLWYAREQPKRLERCLNCLTLYQERTGMVEVNPET
jgi:hypothetical protein